ncbi:MAG: carboxypeptidase-like regulatory domain-containing protein, partial [Leeuwenhoekiella sp.]
MRFLIYFIVILSYAFCNAQLVDGHVLDFSTKEPIPYASITYANAQGVITNDEGAFTINSIQDPETLLKISSLGYQTLELSIKELKQGPVLLHAQSVDLDEVFLSNKRLSGDEIIEKIKININSNYNFNLTQKRFFFRKSSLNIVDQFDIDVNKSTIAELNQGLIDSITNSVNREHDSYLEALGDFYGNYEKQKINLKKAADLYDPASETSITDLTKRLQDIFEKNVKEDSYFKVKSGIIGTTIDSEDLQADKKEDSVSLKEVEKSIEERQKEIADRRKNLKASTNSDIRDLLNTKFWEEDIPFNVFEKSNKYKFEVDGFTHIDGEVVYILKFEPKRGENF